MSGFYICISPTSSKVQRELITTNGINYAQLRTILKIISKRNWNRLMKQNIKLCHRKVLTYQLKTKWYSSRKNVDFLSQNSVISVNFKEKHAEKWVNTNVFVLCYQNWQEEFYNFIIKKGEQQIQRIIVRFAPDSIVGIATRLWAGRFGVQIQAEARDFIFCKMSTLALGSLKLSI